MTQRQLFLAHNAQTSESPLCFTIEKANGAYLYDADGKEYIDAIGGISVANIGHSHPKVIEAINLQANKYLHTMVYGEMLQSPQINFAKLLVDHLPQSLNSVFFTNSGAEATEGAMKLAKRVTNRSKIFAFQNSYHGSTQGALSLIGDEYWRNAFRPLLPNIFHFTYNDAAIIEAIDTTVAAVVLEPIQAESGVTAARKEWLIAISNKCKATGTLLIFDEAQSGFGRTGTLWAFEQYQMVPDILLLAKALGGGLPMGAFIADKKLMDSFASKPLLGHLSTFGGHPLCCASGMAAMKVLLEENVLASVNDKGIYLEQCIKDIGIDCYKRNGLWMSIYFKDFETTKAIIDECIEQGVFTDWFLFASNAMRISPPLIITNQQIKTMCTVIQKAISKVMQAATSSTKNKQSIIIN